MGETSKSDKKCIEEEAAVETTEITKGVEVDGAAEAEKSVVSQNSNSLDVSKDMFSNSDCEDMNVEESTNNDDKSDDANTQPEVDADTNLTVENESVKKDINTNNSEVISDKQVPVEVMDTSEVTEE